jgi:hypothetical protein
MNELLAMSHLDQFLYVCSALAILFGIQLIPDGSKPFPWRAFGAIALIAGLHNFVTLIAR